NMLVVQPLENNHLASQTRSKHVRGNRRPKPETHSRQLCHLTLFLTCPDLCIYFARETMESVYNSKIGFNIYITITFGAHWFSMANSFVNPIIYCYMTENFRVSTGSHLHAPVIVYLLYSRIALFYYDL